MTLSNDASMKKNLVTSIAELQLQLNEIRKRIDPIFSDDQAKVIKEEIIDIEDYENEMIDIEKIDLNKPTVKIYYDEVPNTSFDNEVDEPSEMQIVTSENGISVETDKTNSEKAHATENASKETQSKESMSYKITFLDIPQSNGASVIKPVPEQQLKALLQNKHLSSPPASELRYERPIEKRVGPNTQPCSKTRPRTQPLPIENTPVKCTFDSGFDYFNYLNYYHNLPLTHSQNYGQYHEVSHPSTTVSPLISRQNSAPNLPHIAYYGPPNTQRHELQRLPPQHHRLTYPPPVDLNRNYPQKVDKYVHSWYYQQLADPAYQERQKAQLLARYSNQVQPPQNYTPRRSSTSSIPSQQKSPTLHYHPYGHSYPKSRGSSHDYSQQNYSQQMERQKSKHNRSEALDLRATSTIQSMQNLRISQPAKRDLETLNLHIEMEITNMFAARKREIFNYLYKYVISHSTNEQFIKSMHEMNISYKDYQIVAARLAEKYNYQRKRKIPAADYSWNCTPQKFDDYFITIEDLRSYAKDNMNILAIVVHNLLEQYRDSFKYFLFKMFE